MKILHKLIGMGSAGLVAVVHYPGEATQISHKGQRSTKKKYLETQLLLTFAVVVDILSNRQRIHGPVCQPCVVTKTVWTNTITPMTGPEKIA